jgi:hypothetical protein
MPTFNLDLLNNNLYNYGAILKGEYPKLTQNSKIKFQCKCGEDGQKSFKRLTISGALCDKCTIASHSLKLSKAAERNFKPSESYNKEILDKFVLESGAVLLDESQKLTKETRINFKCSCGNEDSKTFVRIKISGVLCKSCTINKTRIKRETTNLERHGHTCSLQSEEIKKKAENTLLTNYGVTNALLSDVIQNKIKQTNLDKLGAENPFGSEIIINKLRNSCLEKYGTEFPMKNPTIAAKTKATNFIRYGEEVSSKAPSVKEKAKQTNLKKYGKEHHIIPEILEKGKLTNMNKYGVPYSFQSPFVQQKIRKSLLKRYGVVHSSKIETAKLKKITTSLLKYGTRFPMQNKSIFQKQKNTNYIRYGVFYANQSPLIQAKSQETGFSYKTYITPSGAVRKVQGYEPRALDILFKEYKLNESDVITDRGKVPRITYISNNESHYYFPDIYIPSQNKLIEVKSTWTYTLQKNVNHIKWDAAINAGFDCEFWIFTKADCNIISHRNKNDRDNLISHV